MSTPVSPSSRFVIVPRKPAARFVLVVAGVLWLSSIALTAWITARYVAPDRGALAAGEPIRNEEWITYASDGRRLLLETTKVPMRTEDGRVIGVLGVGHDITERQAHQQQLEHRW